MQKSQQEKLQDLLAQIGGYRELIRILQQQISNLGGTRSELSMTLEFLKNLNQLKPDTEILVPVGSGAMIKAKISGIDRVLVEIGSGVVVEKTPNEAIQIIEGRMKDVDEVIARIQKDITSIQEKIEALRPEAEQLMKQMESES
jgi:prefoldin alpha subunit